MRDFVIFTDSCCDLPAELAKEMEVEVLPLSVNMADKEYRTRHLCLEVELLGTDVDISGENIIGDNVLNEGTLIVLFFVIGLSEAEGNTSHTAQWAYLFGSTAYKDTVAKGGVPALEGQEALTAPFHQTVRRGSNGGYDLGEPFSRKGVITGRNDGAICVNDTNDLLGCISELFYNALKNTT